MGGTFPELILVEARESPGVLGGVKASPPNVADNPRELILTARIGSLFDRPYCLMAAVVMLCGVVFISSTYVCKQYSRIILFSIISSSGLHSSSPEDIHHLPHHHACSLCLKLITVSIMAEIKPDVKHAEDDVVTDHHLLGMKQMETAHLVELSEEEKAIEKKLVKRIDWIILPLILAVYLLNWIDRSERSPPTASR